MKSKVETKKCNDNGNITMRTKNHKKLIIEEIWCEIWCKKDIEINIPLNVIKIKYNKQKIDWSNCRWNK